VAQISEEELAHVAVGVGTRTAGLARRDSHGGTRTAGFARLDPGLWGLGFVVWEPHVGFRI